MITSKQILVVFFALFTCIGLSSCDEDLIQSQKLSGIWEGNFSVECTFNGKVYRPYLTKLAFLQDESWSKDGYGYETDYYDYRDFNSVITSDFYWYIEDRVITLQYRGSDRPNTIIRDYRLSNQHFYGYIGESNISFDFEKIAEYSDYNYSKERNASPFTIPGISETNNQNSQQN